MTFSIYFFPDLFASLCCRIGAGQAGGQKPVPTLLSTLPTPLCVTLGLNISGSVSSSVK